MKMRQIRLSLTKNFKNGIIRQIVNTIRLIFFPFSLGMEFALMERKESIVLQINNFSFLQRKK